MAADKSKSPATKKGSSTKKDATAAAAAPPNVGGAVKPQQEAMAEGDSDDGVHYHTIDIRVFLALIVATMAVSFMAGVTLLPPVTVTRTTSMHDDGVVRDAFLLGDTAAAAREADQHRPAGQHLLVDMRGVDSEFLNSEERLAKAMVDTVQGSGLTLLSYHCHALVPSGISCVGILLESHISFHTWPAEGVITLDLFTCGSKPLLPVVPTIERLFGVSDDPDSVRTQWSHELRGFRPEEEDKHNYLADSSDLALWVLSPLEMHTKKQVYAGTTKYQRVDIWDIVEVTDTPSYLDVIKYNLTAGDPRLNSPDYTTPDRLLFLDGTIQSITSAERIYHEALVHPAMFAHPGPKRVAILGGGEGATLREVLKHNTIESALMIELDQELVQLCQEHMPTFSDCSDLKGSAASCYDDERATVEFTDGRQWFEDRFGGAPTTTTAQNKFDVIIVDALDPEDENMVESDMLYSDMVFLKSLVNALSDEGVLVIQVGTAATIDDPRPEFGIYKNRERLFRAFENNPDVATMLIYEEAHCGFLEPHSFLLVCRSDSCRSRWYARSDQVDYQIYERIVRTHSKKRALTFFDGTTQRTYQWPKKGWETVYCRRDPEPWECQYRTMDPKAEIHEFDLEDEKESSFRVEVIGEGDDKETRVYATDDIPKGSFIMPDHLASSLQVTSRNLQGLNNNLDVGGGRVAVIEDLLEFFDEYGHESTAPGSEQHYVEVGGSVLIRRSEDKAEANVEPWVPPHPSGRRPTYSPVYERHRVSFDVFLVASEDIDEGEEVVAYKNMW